MIVAALLLISVSEACKSSFPFLSIVFFYQTDSCVIAGFFARMPALF